MSQSMLNKIFLLQKIYHLDTNELIVVPVLKNVSLWFINNLDLQINIKIVITIICMLVKRINNILVQNLWWFYGTLFCRTFRAQYSSVPYWEQYCRTLAPPWSQPQNQAHLAIYLIFKIVPRNPEHIWFLKYSEIQKLTKNYQIGDKTSYLILRYVICYDR